MNIIKALSTDSLFDYAGIFPRLLDIIIIGDNNIQYLIEVSQFLQKLEKTRDIQILRYATSGYSSFLSIFLCCNINYKIIENFYNSFDPDNWKSLFLSILPSDAFSMCNNRIFIYSCNSLLSKHNVSCIFKTNNDLISACELSILKPCSVSKYCFKNSCIKQLIINTNLLDSISNGVNDIENVFLNKKTNLAIKLIDPPIQSRPSIFLLFMLPVMMVLTYVHM